MGIQNEKSREASVFTLVILSLYILILESPYFSRQTSHMVVYVLMGLLLLANLNVNPVLKKSRVKTYAALLLYTTIEIGYWVLGISDAGMGYYFATVKFLYLFLVMFIIYPKLTPRQELYLCLLSVAGLLFNMVSNCIICAGMDSQVYVTYYLTAEGGRTNAADTAFSTAVLLLCGVMVVLMTSIRLRWLKLVSLGVIGFCMYFLIFVAQRGTTFFLAIIMISVLLILSAGSRSKALVILATTIFTVWLLLGGLGMILDMLSNLLGGKRIGVKLHYVLNFFESGGDIQEAGGSFTSRFNLLQTSLHTWMGSFSNFLIGVGDHRNSNLVVGNHSQIADTFARYGVLGGGVFVWLLLRMRRYLLDCVDMVKRSALYKQTAVLFWVFVIRGLTGNVNVGSIGTQLFVTIPLMVSLLVQERGQT